MKILIVEDSKTDREILKYLLESRFQNAAKFREADSLEAAFGYLSRGDIDCVILDLQLPDSVGKETFEKLITRFPEVPVVVMTNNKDRALALDMIQKGAQEFVIKNFTDEEELFRRVLFAIKRHRQTVRVPTEEAANSVRRLERSKARMASAQETGESKLIETSRVEATNAIADLASRTFTELQVVNALLAKQALLLENAATTTEKLKAEILEGYPNRPSMRSQVELLNSRVDNIERLSRGAVPDDRLSPGSRLIVAIASIALVITLGLGLYLVITKVRVGDVPAHEGG